MVRVVMAGPTPRFGMNHFYCAYEDTVILNSNGQPKPLDFVPYIDRETELPLLFLELKEVVQYIKQQGDTPFVPAGRANHSVKSHFGGSGK